MMSRYFFVLLLASLALLALALASPLPEAEAAAVPEADAKADPRRRFFGGFGHGLGGFGGFGHGLGGFGGFGHGFGMAMDLGAMVSDMATTTTTSLAKRRWRSWQYPTSSARTGKHQISSLQKSWIGSRESL
ncbi:hypothetical protein C7M84_000491 [Penaeus vannamei]|uniref:Uncharacterized protein n=1 Tax=Penaeus vannamei TaxID=6689 RepID=A0A3R7N9C6_PENVA|nr:uncharacterized protein LOC113805188 isoform X1 [Penaeus vannamei]XP_027211960.1 uncharacterized protein LOC113805188 isoform X2 [Penaeus vannamei]XP_027211968.1 uncharacterized protein LOC113805188 isoform X3 [Penaeus vannamei]ROT80764.1 hypothetical protein C7M84_000491 [Penaeus vannamei]